MSVALLTCPTKPPRSVGGFFSISYSRKMCRVSWSSCWECLRELQMSYRRKFCPYWIFATPKGPNFPCYPVVRVATRNSSLEPKIHTAISKTTVPNPQCRKTKGSTRTRSLMVSFTAVISRHDGFLDGNRTNSTRYQIPVKIPR